jgi:endoribonuclease LACTB2
MREREILNSLADQSEGQKGELEREGNSWTPMDIVKVVYKDVPRSLHIAVQRGVVQVLAKLEGEGRVEKTEGGRWRIAQNHPHETTNEDEVVQERKSAL